MIRATSLSRESAKRSQHNLSCKSLFKMRISLLRSCSCLLFFFFLRVFPSPFVRARTLQNIPTTSIFDVSASIRKANEILSFDPETLQLQELEVSEEGISSYKLKLYSRDILHTRIFETYRDLTLSRFERDAARVNYLKSADAPITRGTNQSGEYFAQMGFGTPSKVQYTVVDTGSDITWIQCSPCTDCYRQTDPIFDPSSSSSYNPLSCDSTLCEELTDPSCNSGSCGYRVSYGDGSSTSGDFATETVTIGGSEIKDVAVGCGHENTGLFVGASGLLGLGLGPLSFPSQINISAFSYCLVDKDSTSSSTLEFGSSTTSSITAPLLTNKTDGRTFYYVGLTGISVSGKMLPIPPSSFAIGANGEGGVILDSGTTVTRFPSRVYNLLRDEFVKGTKDLKSVPGFSILDTCYELASTEVDVPVVAFHFGANSLSLSSKNILTQVADNTFCFAFATFVDESWLSIIGNTQQQGIRVSYDIGKSEIGFLPEQC